MALALDGATYLDNSGPSVPSPTVSLTTANTNDIIVLISGRNGCNITAVVGSTLGAFTQLFTPASSTGIDVWVSFSAAALTGEVVTITQVNSNDNKYSLFGVSGSNQTSLTGAFDSGGPQVSATAPISITTANANTMVVGAFNTQFVQHPGQSSGFTVISDDWGLMTEYKVLSATGTQSPGTNGNDGIVNNCAAFAIVQAAGGGGDTLFAQSVM